MSLPFIKVRTSEWLDRASLAPWSLDNRAPVLWVEMDLAVLTATGRLDDLSVRDLAARWGWPRSTAGRKLKEGVGRIWDSSGTVVGRERDTPNEVEPTEPDDAGTPVGRSWDGRGTRGRIPYESRRGVEVREQQAAQAPAPVSAPKAKSPKAIEAEQGLACLRTLRGELHQAATGKRHTANWGKGAAGAVLGRKIARLLDECRGRELDPLPCLEALARWVYGAPGADWLRSRSSPLVDALGGNALTRASRVDDALAWVEGGQPKSSPNKSRGKPSQRESFSDRLKRQGQEQNMRVINGPTERTS